MTEEYIKYRRFKYFIFFYISAILIYANITGCIFLLYLGDKGIILELILINGIYILLFQLLFIYYHTPIKVEIFDDKIKVIYPINVVYINYSDIKNVEIGYKKSNNPCLLIEFNDIKYKVTLTPYIISKNKIYQIYDQIMKYKQRNKNMGSNHSSI